ncbi:ThiF family adenylyltransferase, partial [Kitasatospora sp. NPDC059747]|uniref:ThiF family adenylyltransferase n=1 Tax=Kitasatospora sp. NPDC059747 TaxID=3346930 RepID=UPI00365114CD
MRLALKPALSRSWRDTETLQFGTISRYAGVVEHADKTLCDFLGLLDGTRDRPALLAAGEKAGLGRDPAEALLAELEEAGLLDDAEAAEAALARFPQPHRELLGPDLASLSLVHSGPGAAPAVLARRADTRIEVRGAGRVGAAVAAVLAAGGAGAVTVKDGGRVRPGDCSPAGVPPSDVGRLRMTAAKEAVQRASARRPAPAPRRAADAPPDLVVLAPRDGSGAFAGGAYEARQLLRAGVPHLYVGVVEEFGVVGPLVVPGVSACGHCLVLRREDEDAAWPRVLAQLADGGPGRARTPACDTAMATAVAGLAALHVQVLLDGGRPPSVNGWCEFSATDGMPRRMRLRGHPDWGGAGPLPTNLVIATTRGWCGGVGGGGVLL